MRRARSVEPTGPPRQRSTLARLLRPAPLRSVSGDPRRGGRRLGSGLGRDRSLSAESKTPCKLRALGGIIGRDHRIIVGQAPLRPILLGRQSAALEMAPQGFVPLAVLEADQEIWRDGLLDRYGRHQLLGFGGLCRLPEIP